MMQVNSAGDVLYPLETPYRRQTPALAHLTMIICVQVPGSLEATSRTTRTIVCTIYYSWPSFGCYPKLTARVRIAVAP